MERKADKAVEKMMSRFDLTVPDPYKNETTGCGCATCPTAQSNRVVKFMMDADILATEELREL